MASLYNADLKPLTPGVYTHSYEHATKLFIADTFRLAPKQSFLYYVCINISQNAISSLLSTFGGDSISSQGLIEQYQTGILAKRVDLPRFNIDTKTYNAYNRKNIVTNRINYDALTITFHDDAADIVTSFWNDYYTYYFRDSDYNNELYSLPHKYQQRYRSGWGYTPRLKSLIPFLNNIQIFSLHNKRFTEYQLINPTITNWRHGELSSENGTGIVESSMTIQYETVKYKTGYINITEMPGFGTINYDNYPSPISKSVTNIYTDAGIIGAIAGGAKDLARPDGDGSGRGLTGNLLDAYRTITNLKNVNFKSVASVALGQVGSQVLNQVINSIPGAINKGINQIPGSSDLTNPALNVNAELNKVIAPTLGGIFGGTSQLLGKFSGALGVIPRAIEGSINSRINQGVDYVNRQINDWTTARVQDFKADIALGQAGAGFADEDAQAFGGAANPPKVATVTDSADNPIGQELGGSATVQTNVNTDTTRGIATEFPEPYDPWSSIAMQNEIPSDNIAINVETGQPLYGQQETSFAQGDTGGLDSYNSFAGDSFGGFYPDYPDVNLVYSDWGYASPPIIYNTYRDGTVVVRNADNEILQIYPGSSGAPIAQGQSQYVAPGGIVNTNPLNTRDLAMAGKQVKPDQPQYYTDPATGQITNLKVSNFRIVNKSYDILASENVSTSMSATKTLTGQVGSAVDSLATKNVQKYVAPGGVRPIRNPVTGAILQSADNLTGSIQNVLGSWAGTGGYLPANPQQNVISKQVQPNQDVIYTYKDGSVVTIDKNNTVLSIVKGSVNNNLTNWYASTFRQSPATPNQPGQILTDGKGTPYPNK